MAEKIQIHLTLNSKTGEKEIIIEYDGEPEETPIEHERRHRAIVKELLGKGIINPDDQEKIKVTRKKPVTAGSGGGGGRKNRQSTSH